MLMAINCTFTVSGRMTQNQQLFSKPAAGLFQEIGLPSSAFWRNESEPVHTIVRGLAGAILDLRPGHWRKRYSSYTPFWSQQRYPARSCW